MIDPATLQAAKDVDGCGPRGWDDHMYAVNHAARCDRCLSLLLAWAQTPRWRKVSEELPKAKSEVLVIALDGEIGMAEYHRPSRSWRDIYSYSVLEPPTHWLPLPEGPDR